MKLCESLLDRKEVLISGLYGRYRLSLDLREAGLQSSFYYFIPERYEFETQRCLAENVRPGMTVVDVGAHLGLLTILLADKVTPSGRVYSFEPERKNFLRLKRNVEINRLDWVRPVPMALSDETGDDLLSLHASGAGHALARGAGTELAPPGTVNQEIRTVALDDFIRREGIKKIDLMKIDAEGSEPLVLEGARRAFLGGLVGKVICEIHSSDKESEAGRDRVRKIFYSYGYRSYVLNPMLSGKPYLAEFKPHEPVRGLQNFLFVKS